LVVCDEEKLTDGKACKGPPDFIIEVASSGSKGKDFIDKKELYEKAKVKEYWIVDEDKVYVYVLDNNCYRETIHKMIDGLVVKTTIFKGCEIVF